MSDLLKILVFSLFLSFLWVIPRFDLIFQWISEHVWQSSIIGLSIVFILVIVNWIKSKRATKVQNEQLQVEKSQG
ncbi:hypothetical protein [Halalkalibacter alkaliphilus]|uniref:Uncharacterized protein n=1 Tax=Halalkalibacter alkaliphilus TaxID=2917993 RepID=A0A9X2I7D7_9BACI|nr:hypothetical protein [Halalkalibacter alkaliphilus]MCL7749422.1 hypothetical protein [Halalkalibacter alkaliphilus]